MRTNTNAETTPPSNQNTLSGKTERAIEAIKAQVLSFSQAYTAYTDLGSTLVLRRKEIAPKFMKAFAMWQEETPNGDFVGFVRHLDPNTPLEREAYRAYRTFQACQYLKRLNAVQERKELAVSEGRSMASDGPRPLSQGDAVARLVASLLPVIPQSEQGKFWAGLQHELHWTERQIEKLQESISSVEPLVMIKVPNRGVIIRLVHPINGRDTALAS